ncbi:MAG: 4-hydroxyphenyl-beta-ketoacyl-CoA hydrolase [Acidobacteria bacterium]|nr:MAG: 4-hydroxyphenyl-beta-ketoacyl-CoA hydrolase [Acidobacteriota bacterium]
MPEAIDVHVHPSTEEYLKPALGPFTEATEKYFRTSIPIITIDEMAAEFEADDVLAVLFAWDAETATGLPPVTNDYIADAVRAHPDRFRGFASVDPHKGDAAIAELDRAVSELGLIGLKTQAGAQDFRPDDRQFYPLWEKAAELGIPVLFHVGTTGLGAGTPGGMGVKLDNMRPIYVDTVAANFPDLKIIAAHPAWPWQDEMIAIALHKANVWIDLSGWSPKYFSEPLVREIKTRLQDRVMFGTDYPFITYHKWITAFDELGIPEDVRTKVIKTNAATLLGIEI